MSNKLFAIIISIVCTLPISAQTNLEFIQNKGQWDTAVLFKGDMGNGAFFLRHTGFTVTQYHPDDLSKIRNYIHGGLQAATGDNTIRAHAYTMELLGAATNIRPVAEKPEQSHTNYFIGNDPSKWTSNCGIFHEVTYKNIYPGIDVKYYAEDGMLKYEFIVHPGADPKQIAMQFNGVDKLSVKNNELLLATSVGTVKELTPYTYQAGLQGRQKVDCRYKLDKNNIVHFSIKDYDPAQTLVIDPTLIFASFTGSTADNWGYTATYGPDGSFFSGGIVFGNGYRVSTGAYRTSFQGGAFDMGIMKLSPDGSQRLYATYIGGDGEDQPHSLFCDPLGNLVIAGRTNSSVNSYPAKATFAGSNGLGVGTYDIVVAKLSADGSQLLGSARIGGTGNDGFNVWDSHTKGPNATVGNYGDDARSEVILDPAGNIYLASCTMSSDFYTTPNAVQTKLSGTQDAVLIKLTPDCSSVLYSSYFGGSGYEAGFVLALNPTNSDIYMAGATTTGDTSKTQLIPGNKAGVIQATNGGGRTDGFIAVFSNDGSVLRRSTYIGTGGIDFVYGIQFDKKGYPYIMGTTTGSTTDGGIFTPFNAAYSVTGSKQFVIKLQPDLSAKVYSTVFGTANSNNPNISPVAFLVDRCENVYVSGWGKGFNPAFGLAGTLGMPLTNDAIQRTTDNEDFYFIVIQKNASALLYGSFFGQSGPLGEHVDGGTSRYDQQGVIYQAICANCAGDSRGTKYRWPVTPGAWCCTSGRAPAAGAGCNLGMVKIAFNFAGVGSSVKSLIDGKLDSTGCIPLTVNLRDTIRNAKTYIWHFGDGSPDTTTTASNVFHTYTNVGNYRVMLVAIDSNTCNVSDTSYITIIAKDNKANISFTYNKVPPCESLEYAFTNTSTAPAGLPFTNKSFVWDFGDGTRTAPQGLLPDQDHIFPAVGTYNVRLVLVDTSYCNFPDSASVLLRVAPLVRAQFETPATGCAPYTATFNNTSLGGQTFSWDFGDPASGAANTSTDINPTHLYASAGTYTIKLTAVDPNTCNVQHDTTFTITVYDRPMASFTFTPVPPINNTPDIFTNTSSPDAIRFDWLFGDTNDTLHTTSRAPISHQYDETFTYHACLIAYNQAGCSDTSCQDVPVIVTPQVDVPNAFTPAQNNTANVIYVRGFAIGQLHFTIYNRFGQKVFETTDKTQGWDGRFKGVIQPMDVYAYTLEVQFTDGTHTTKKGDITLIR